MLTRLLSAILLLASFGVSSYGQDMLPTTCYPHGSTFTESFGNGPNHNWATGPSTSDHLWAVGSGTAYSIVTPSAGFPLPNCKHALQMAHPGTSALWLSTPADVKIPAGSVGDIYAAVLVTAQSITAYDAVSFFSLSGANNGAASIVLNMQFYKAGSAFQVRAYSSASSTGIAVSVGTGFFVHVHLSGGANSTISLCAMQGNRCVDTGSPQTFTQASNAGLYWTTGGTNATDAVTYQIVTWANFPGISSCARNTYPGILQDFHTGTLGNHPAATDLTAGMYGGNGSWTTTGSVTQLSYVSATGTGFVRQPDVCGVYYPGTSTVALSYATGTAGQYVQITPTGLNTTPLWPNIPSVAMGFEYWTTIPDLDTKWYDSGHIVGRSSADGITFSLGGGATFCGYAGLCLFSENNASTTTKILNISSGVHYKVVVVYMVTGSYHYVYVYDMDNNLLGSVQTANVGGVLPAVFEVGNTGSETQAAGYTLNWRNVWIACSVVTQPF